MIAPFFFLASALVLSISLILAIFFHSLASHHPRDDQLSSSYCTRSPSTKPFFFFALIFSPLRQVSFLNVTHSYYLSIPPTHQPACLPACLLFVAYQPTAHSALHSFFFSFFFILKNNNPTVALSISRCPPRPPAYLTN